MEEYNLVPIPEQQLELQPRHNQIARLTALGWNHRQIAEKLGMSETQISVVSRSPLFKSVVEEISRGIETGVKRALDTLAEAAPKAADKLVDILDAPQDQRMAKEVAVEILKASGASRNHDSPVGVTVNINEAKLNLILTTLKEIR